MVYNHAKNKAPGARRDEEVSGDSHDTDSYSRVGLSGKTARNQPFGVSRTHRTGPDFSDRPGGGNPGKILKQLIQEARQELSSHLQEIEILKERLEGLEALEEQLSHKTIEEQ